MDHHRKRPARTEEDEMKGDARTALTWWVMKKLTEKEIIAGAANILPIVLERQKLNVFVDASGKHFFRKHG